MLYNYFKIAWRNLTRNKVFSGINLVGLAAGMTACILILHYVSFQLSYDNFHKDPQTLYRLGSENIKSGMRLSTHLPIVGPTIKESFPEVLESVRMFPRRGVLVHDRGDKVISFKADNYTYTDPEFTRIFSFPGMPEGGLTEPYSVLLSSKVAKKYFGSRPALGKTVTLYDDFGEVSYTVRGVYPDFPKNSHLKFDMLVSFHRLEEFMYDKMYISGWGAFMTYLRLKPLTSAENLESKIALLVAEKMGKENDSRLFLQPLDEIYLHSDFVFDKVDTGDAEEVSLLALLAFFILLLAWVNYVNLTTARSLDRAREVGIRKVLGAWKRQLFGQFLWESILVNAIAFSVAGVVAELSLPWVYQVAGIEMDALGGGKMALAWWMGLMAFFFAGAVIAGLYPAWVLARFQAAEVLKSRITHSHKGQWLRKGLVVFQFGISVLLMVGTLAAYQQLGYMQSRDLGVQVDQVLVVEGPEVGDSTLASKLDIFKQQVRALPGVTQAIGSGTIPGMYSQYTTRIRVPEDVSEEKKHGAIGHVQPGFFEFYGMKVVQGRAFDPGLATDESAILVTRAVLETLGIPEEDALTTSLILGDEGPGRPILGVVENFHYDSPADPYIPMIFENKGFNNSFISLRLSVPGEELSLLMDQIRESYAEVLPGNPFTSVFLDEYFDQRYRDDRSTVQIFTLFAMLAIFIASMGLFGLSVYTTLQRTKEIGIRKVMGASVSQLVVLLSSDFIRLVLVASLIVLPLAWFGVYKWLESFAFKMSISPLIFLVPVLLVLFIATITVTLHTLRSARANPVEALRWE